MSINEKIKLHSYCRRIRGCEYYSLKKKEKDEILKMFLWRKNG